MAVRPFPVAPLSPFLVCPPIRNVLNDLRFVGSHTITAQYLGVPDYAASPLSSLITQTVNSLSYAGSTNAGMTNAVLSTESTHRRPLDPPLQLPMDCFSPAVFT